MSIGNDLIDQDHRYLLCLFNSIELALSHEERDELLPVFFNQLLEYTRIHFDREEKIQLKMGFAGHFEHKKEHQSIVLKLQEVHEELHRKNPKYRDNLLDLIRKWVVEHLIVTDKSMAEQLKKFPRNFH